MKSRWLRNIPLIVLVLLAAAYLGAGAYLATGKVLGERHLDIGDDAYAYPADAQFGDYLAWANTHLHQWHPEADGEVIAANLAPFMLEPDSTCPRTADGRWQHGIVLIHGLIDSPYSMRPIGEDLRERCFLVFGLLLPDHGTRPGDMLDSSREDWLLATHFATEQMALNAAQVFIAGHSAGGALAILEAGRNPAVDGLVLFAPALSIAPVSRYARFITPLGLFYPGAAWFELKRDTATYRYESFPFRAAAETWALIQATWSAMNDRVRGLPVFTVASMEDNTVGTEATLQFMAENSDPDSMMLLYSQHPVAAADPVRVISSSAPESGVLSLSHLGLMTPPDHPWFGRDGAYRNCGHYEEGGDAFRQCKAGMRAWYGEATAENLATGIIERIAFNPWYEAMLGELDAWLSRVSAQ
jgi:alpha-beta hydrolase superfamily lysophospholipase